MLIVYGLAAIGACSVARVIAGIFFDMSGNSGERKHWLDED